MEIDNGWTIDDFYHFEHVPFAIWESMAEEVDPLIVIRILGPGPGEDGCGHIDTYYELGWNSAVMKASRMALRGTIIVELRRASEQELDAWHKAVGHFYSHDNSSAIAISDVELNSTSKR